MRSYRIAAGAGSGTGALGRDQGLGIAAPTAFEGITTYGQAWVVLAAGGTSSLSVMAVAANGDLTLLWQGIESQDGNRLNLEDLWPLSWQQPHHLPVGGTLSATVLAGSAGADVLMGVTPMKSCWLGRQGMGYAEWRRRK